MTTTERIVTLLGPKEAKRLKEIARYHNMSLSKLVRRILLDWLRHYELELVKVNKGGGA